MAMYYPQKTVVAMGPTAIGPATQVRKQAVNINEFEFERK